MSLVRSKGTKPEMAVRRLLHAMGFRFRLHRRDLPGCPDIVLPRHNTVVFVHGCFWHQHGDPACWRSRMPKTRQDFWVPKLERNVARDQEVGAALAALGWSIVVVWECETTPGKKVDLEARLRAAIGGSG
ncbi:very short patch repair endonuclease [Pleomorphomonas sp. NRK JP5]|nr:very short patch repair endonuclease [Pleomorphomonas sp. JP5]